MQQQLEYLLERKDAPLFQILNKEQVKKLLHAQFTWPWYGQLMKEPQTMAYLLQMNVWLEYYAVEIL